MSDVDKLVPLSFAPGIQRDGTQLDTDQPTYVNGEWVRFQRGRPRKMGGYVRLTDRMTGPIRDVLVYPSGGFGKVLCFSSSSIEELVLDGNGTGNEFYDRTPTGFTISDDNVWSSTTMFDDAAGAEESIVLAVVSQSLSYIDSDSEGEVYSGLLSDQTAFAELADVTAKGVFVAQPYAVYYGAYGKVIWSNANEPLNITTGDAGQDRVTGAHIVAGKPLATGSGAGGLLFSLDSVIRMDWIGGNQIFKFTTITNSSSILSQKCVVEHDGMFYWIGVDRFFVSDGQSVKSLPNMTNSNWFFDNVNRSKRQLVWGTKNARFNEIIWHFPFGNSDVCDRAIVFNYAENCWYDYSLSRSAGSLYYTFPIQAEPPTDSTDIKFLMSIDEESVFEVGDQVEGQSSAVIYEITLIVGDNYYAKRISTSGEWIIGESLDNLTQTGTASLDSFAYLCSVYKHESGVDRIEGQNQLAIRSSYTTSNIGITGIKEPINRWTRILRVEPDFVQFGDLKLYIITKEFANSEEVIHGPYSLEEITEKQDLGIQGRHVFFKIESNVIRGDYQQGRLLLHAEPGDKRS